jgi:hypothetical protein
LVGTRWKEEEVPASDQAEIRAEITVANAAEADVGVSFPNIGVNAVLDPKA